MEERERGKGLWGEGKRHEKEQFKNSKVIQEREGDVRGRREGGGEKRGEEKWKTDKECEGRLREGKKSIMEVLLTAKDYRGEMRGEETRGRWERGR